MASSTHFSSDTSTMRKQPSSATTASWAASGEYASAACQLHVLFQVHIHPPVSFFVVILYAAIGLRPAQVGRSSFPPFLISPRFPNSSFFHTSIFSSAFSSSPSGPVEGDGPDARSNAAVHGIGVVLIAVATGSSANKLNMSTVESENAAMKWCGYRGSKLTDMTAVLFSTP